jgi:acyl carrier protein
MYSKSTEGRVKQLIFDITAYDEIELDVTASLSDQILTDSLDQVEFVMALEEEFDIEIPDDDAVQWKTIKDVLDYLRRRGIL